MIVPLPQPGSPPQTHTIEMNARAFAFDPASLTVQKGDRVTIRLESLDARHGLFIDGYDIQIQAEPGKSAQVTWIADKDGKFNFRCSVTCGVLHPFMIGELTVAPVFPFLRAISVTMITAVGASLFFWKA